MSVAIGIKASVWLILVSIFDTLRYRPIHQSMLYNCIGPMTLYSLLTMVVWFDQTWKAAEEWDSVGKWLVLSACKIYAWT